MKFNASLVYMRDGGKEEEKKGGKKEKRKGEERDHKV